MKSIWKSQWFSLSIGLIYLIATFTVPFVKSGIYGDMLMIACALGCITWLTNAKVDYQDEKIKALEKEIEQIKNRAITDVIETEPNHYVCMRKLGPDKGVK